MVGDSYKADIKPAIELGINTIQYIKKRNPHDDADYVIKDFSELYPIINKPIAQ